MKESIAEIDMQLKQVINWIEIDWKLPIEEMQTPPHREQCYFLKSKFGADEPNEIITGYYQVHDGKWVIVNFEDVTMRIPLIDFTHFCKAEDD